MEHLFKLKKDGETVGFLELFGHLQYPETASQRPPTAVCGLRWLSADKSELFLNDAEIIWDTVHPFVCLDKHGKEVFKGDKASTDMKELTGEDEVENVDPDVVAGFWFYDVGGMTFVPNSEIVGDIRLIE